MKKLCLILVGLLTAALVIAGPKAESRRADSIAIKSDSRWTTYADVTIHEAQAGYIHFTVNGGTVVFVGEPPRVTTNLVSRGLEIIHSGEYQVHVSTAKR